VTLPITVDP